MRNDVGKVCESDGSDSFMLVPKHYRDIKFTFKHSRINESILCKRPSSKALLFRTSSTRSSLSDKSLRADKLRGSSIVLLGSDFSFCENAFCWQLLAAIVIFLVKFCFFLA